MTIEMTTARLINSEAIGFGDIVEQRRPHKRRGNLARWIPAIDAKCRQLAGNSEDASNMVVHIKGMVTRTLVKTAARLKLWNGGAHKIGVADHRVPSPSCSQNTRKLDPHALPGNRIKKLRALGKSRRGLSLHGKIKTASETNGPQHSKCVFLEASAGYANRANKALRKVRDAVVHIEKTARWMPRHGIDSEIPASKVIQD